ncbi:lamin tail domain-containing protein [Halorientalis brevis]|uniref:Lamin tail domain-containing protein n=1 Tax=Halorientalis brevis TaxID=1126241 RepID=A0ABD6CFX5_9EURY|nr:lamin tail domain-containing protein [Halorientalis brevis]
MSRRAIVVVAMVAVVALAGCAGDPGAPTTTAPGTAPTTPAETASDGTPTAPVNPLIQHEPNGTLDVHFINTGLGTSTLIVGPTNETLLIDSGDWQDDGEHVLAYLQAHDIDRLDYLVSTHADADHIGGQAAVIEYVETEGEGVGAVYDPGITASTQTYERYLDAIEQYDVTLYETRAGDSIPMAGTELDVLAPPEPSLASGDRNENSIVLRLGFGQSSFLLPGDAATDGEEYLTSEYGTALNVSVLLAGHHGSKSSSSEQFLDGVAPRVAVISSPYDSQYGHPHEEVLQRLAARSVTTYWTATHGDIVLTSNGSAISVATQQQAPTAPLDLRDGSAIEPETGGDVTVRTVVDVAGGQQVVTDGGTATPDADGTATPTELAPSTDEAPSGALSIAEIHADASGDEYDNLNDEYVVFENTGEQSVDLSGWTLSDDADHVYTFPDGFVLEPGATVTVHTGSGTDSATDLYWGSDAPVWNNGGDTVTVRDANGDVVIEESYS